MLDRSRHSAIVRNVIESTLMVQSGDNVMVETWDHGLPLAAEFVFQLRAIGARPMLLFEHEETFWRSVMELPPEKLGKLGDHEWGAMEKAKHYIFVPGPGDYARMLRSLPKFRAGVAYNESWYENAKKFRTKGARLTLGYATKQRARAYRLNLSAWQNMLAKASSTDFRSIRERAAKLANIFRGSEKVRITSPGGTDLRFRLLNRSPWADDCVIDEADLDSGNNMTNIPAGNLIVAPDESSPDGSVVFDRASPNLGNWVGGMKWVFEDGTMTSCKAKRNERFLQAAYEKGEGDKNRLDALSIGLNPAIKPGFLQDEYALGCVSVSLGDNQYVGGANKTEFFFRGVLTNATLTVDGEAVINRGKLVVN